MSVNSNSSRPARIATLMVHTSPLDQAGTGDAGGMNVYVTETAKKMAEANVAVDIFTRKTRSDLADRVEIAPGVNVFNLEAGPYEGISKEELPSQICADRKSTRLNSSHSQQSRMPSSA